MDRRVGFQPPRDDERTTFAKMFDDPSDVILRESEGSMAISSGTMDPAVKPQDDTAKYSIEQNKLSY